MHAAVAEPIHHVVDVVVLDDVFAAGRGLAGSTASRRRCPCTAGRGRGCGRSRSSARRCRPRCPPRRRIRCPQAWTWLLVTRLPLGRRRRRSRRCRATSKMRLPWMRLSTQPSPSSMPQPPRWASTPSSTLHCSAILAVDGRRDAARLRLSRDRRPCCSGRPECPGIRRPAIGQSVYSKAMPLEMQVAHGLLRPCPQSSPVARARSDHLGPGHVLARPAASS